MLYIVALHREDKENIFFKLQYDPYPGMILIRDWGGP